MPQLSNPFANRSIASKLAAMTIVGAMCMALMATAVLLVARNQSITERTEKAQAIVDAVWQIADGFQQAAAAGKMTDEEAKARFFAVASSVWYEAHTNYIFIYDTETGISVANPGIPTLLGQDMRNVKDANGLPFASMLMDIARQGDGPNRFRRHRHPDAAVDCDSLGDHAQRHNVQRAAQGTSQGAADISDVQRGVAETGAASSQVLAAAKSLSNESSRLKREVGKFMDSVRAA